MAWHRKSSGNIVLRVTGAVLLVGASLCGSWLRDRAALGLIDSDPIAFLLAAATFLSGSGGALLLVLGAHIFDQVEVASPWYRIGRAAPRERSDGQ